jgi:hypothetical protein
VRERIRFATPGLLENRSTVSEPKALTKPWEVVRTYCTVSPPNDELRECACRGLTRELLEAQEVLVMGWLLDAASVLDHDSGFAQHVDVPQRVASDGDHVRKLPFGDRA